MSTPSTLPPHHPAHGFSHPHNYQSVNGYRGPGNLLHGASRLGGAPSSAVASSATAVAPVEHAHIPPRTLSTLVAHTAAPMAAVAASALPRKRPRSREPREPDWNDFYKNGLPKEVIIIDDSPEPDTASLTHSYAVRGSDDAQTGHMAKKRKRDGTGQAAYEPIYPPGTTVNQHTAAKPPHSQSASTISTDRTESAHLTTAHTSLGSYSSGALAYPLPIPEAQAQAGQKRKRTATRSQNAAEAKRKEWGTNGDTWLSYRPPPLPPLKSGEVHVKQIPDVSGDAFLIVRLC